MKNKQDKSTVEQLREIRDKISAETQDMNFEELKKYIDERMVDTLHPNVVWK